MDIRGATDIAARSKKLALKTRDPDDMALAESMLAASNHLLGNHIIAQQHCESGLRYSESGPRFRAGQHLFHYTSFLLVGMARSLLYRGLLDRSLQYAKLAMEEGPSGHILPIPDSDRSCLSIGRQKGPRIGVQKGPLYLRSRMPSARPSGAGSCAAGRARVI